MMLWLKNIVIHFATSNNINTLKKNKNFWCNALYLLHI